MVQSKNPNPARHSKPRGIRVGLFLVRSSLLGIVTLALLIGVAWGFGAIWFDFPFSVLRRPLAIAFGLAAIGALAFVRPRWLGPGRRCRRDRAGGRLGAYNPCVQHA